MKRAAPIICLVLAATGLSLIPLLHDAPPLFAQYRLTGHNIISKSDRAQNVPLLKIIKTIKRDYGGRLLEVELERERIGGALVLVYEAKILTPSGNVLKLYYDAKTGQLLQMKGRHSKSRAQRKHRRRTYERDYDD